METFVTPLLSKGTLTVLFAWLCIVVEQLSRCTLELETSRPREPFAGSSHLSVQGWLPLKALFCPYTLAAVCGLPFAFVDTQFSLGCQPCFTLADGSC
jgi:hypothetical protein